MATRFEVEPRFEWGPALFGGFFAALFIGPLFAFFAMVAVGQDGPHGAAVAVAMAAVWAWCAWLLGTARGAWLGWTAGAGFVAVALAFVLMQVQVGA